MTTSRMSTGKYAAAYVALLLLSGLTFGFSFLGLGAGEWLVALGIAGAKALIVAWYFMHLMEMSASHRSAAGVAAVLLAVLVLLTLGDVWTRAPAPSPSGQSNDQLEQPLTVVEAGGKVREASQSIRLSVSATRAGEPGQNLPEPLGGVGIVERLEQQLPLNLHFTNTEGRRVRLGQWFGQGVPTIITLNYSECPMLCSLELNGLVDAMQQSSLKLGEDYRIVTVSLDPNETPEMARQTQARYLAQYGQPSAAGAWAFLIGDSRNIKRLADAVGFLYRRDADSGQFYHAAAIAIASPEGRIMRYLYGIEYEPKTLKLALVEASKGRVGTTLDRLILYCSLYNPREGSYAMVASRVITFGSLVVVAGLGSALLLFWYRELARRRRKAARQRVNLA